MGLGNQEVNGFVMIRCQNCGTEHLEASQYCDECGAKLAPPVRPMAPTIPGTVQTVSPKPDVESNQRPQKTLARAVVESPAPSPVKLVVIRSGRIGHEFPLTGTRWLIGRWDPDHGVFPDVDLDADDPEANVSRRHAQIVLHEGQYLVEDLGSTNGTFINRGHRLIPGRRYLLQEGDELIVGKTFLKFVTG